MDKVRIAGAVTGIAIVSALVLHTSSAAFTGETSNDGNSWAAGTVTLTDDDDGHAMYESQHGIVPGYSETRCIEVTYGGSVTPSTPVTLSAVTTSTAGGGTGDGLADDLTVLVEIAAAGAGCDSLTGLVSVHSGPLDGFPSAGTPADTGWTPALGTDVTRAFQFTVALPPSTGNDAQGDAATADFTWAVTG